MPCPGLRGSKSSTTTTWIMKKKGAKKEKEIGPSAIRPGSAPRTIPFWDDKGNQINIPANYRIDDLVRMGAKDIRLHIKGDWLGKGWFVNQKPKQKQERKKKT